MFRGPRSVRCLSLVALTAWLALVPAPARSQATDTSAGLRPLEDEIARLAGAARGTVGVAAIHLETGRSVWLNPDVAFPMASTYKVPIALQLLTMVDEGRLRLDSMITVPQEDVYRTASTISDLLHQPGLSLSVRNLMELMLRVSDNIATDVLFRTAGGSQAITERMRALGFSNIRVDRPTWALIAGFVGRPDVTEANRVYPDEYLELLRRPRSDEEQAAHVRAFNADPRDTATPRDMGELLVRLWKGELLSRQSTDLLLDIMYRCDTGPARLKGVLPPGTRVAHKTGTIGETTNDIGIIDLPGGAGHAVAVVYIKESKLPDSAAMEPVIAQISRAIHDYFTFVRGS